jgi:hypothetical protein
LNPYRVPAAIAGAAVDAPAPHARHRARGGGEDVILPLLLAGGGIIALAGAVFVDGTELALGGVAVMAACRRAATYDS